MARVLIPFRDSLTWMSYDKGDEYDGTPERIQELVGGGYIQCAAVTASDAENAPEDAESAANDDLGKLTVAQLRAICDERGIDVPKRASKPKLLEALGA